MTIKVDIIIVGAGLIGSALALLLAKRKPNLCIAIVERGPQLLDNHFPNQRVVALGRVATEILDDVGILPKLGASFANPYEKMFVWDEYSDGELSFNAKEHDLDALGSMVDSVQCTLLLQQAIAVTDSIKTFYSSEPVSFTRYGGQAQLSLADETLKAPLIIAADGASSWLRKQVKIFANHRAYKQKGIVAKISTERPHLNTAWQRFLSSGPLAFLPVADNQCSIVWSAGEQLSMELMSLNNDEFAQRLSQAFEGRLGHVSVLSKPIAFPLVSQQAQTYFTQNVALVGDAAHSIHPLAGQGANLGFKDIQALTELLCNESVTCFSDVGLLQAYQRCRQKDNQQTDFMMSALHHAFQGRLPVWMLARGLGMNILNRSEGIKNMLVKQAIGA